LRQAQQRKTFMLIFVQNAIRSLPANRSLLILADVLRDSIEDLISKNKSFRGARIALKGFAIAKLRAASKGAAHIFKF